MYGARGQLDEWTMESRIRFGLVWGSFNALIFIALLAAFGDLSVSLAAAALVISVLAQALIWYPMAKRKIAREHNSMAQ